MKYILFTLPVLALALGFARQDDDLKSKLKDSAAEFWIYDDLEEGFKQAKAADKPLLLSLR